MIIDLAAQDETSRVLDNLASVADDVAPKRIGIEDMEPGKYLVFGSMFILGLNSALFPLDTLTTIVMAEARREGIPRFWRGLGASVVGTFPGQAAYYLGYETAQSYTSKHWDAVKDTPYTTFLKGFISGACAELVGGLFYVPADVISQRLQVQNLNNFTKNARLYNGAMSVVQRIWAQERFKGFYRGYFAYLCSYAPGSAVQWGAYEVAKQVLHSGLFAIEKRTHISLPQRDHLVNALSGGIAALCAVTANNPIEVIRVRTQLLDTSHPTGQATLSGGYLSLAKTILQKEGWKMFYTGLRIRICMAVPTAMVAMSGYETVKAMSLD